MKPRNVPGKPPRPPALLVMLMLPLWNACAPVSPLPSAPIVVQAPRPKARLEAARPPTKPPECSPSCSAAAALEFESWLDSPTKATTQRPPPGKDGP